MLVWKTCAQETTFHTLNEKCEVKYPMFELVFRQFMFGRFLQFGQKKPSRNIVKCACDLLSRLFQCLELLHGLLYKSRAIRAIFTTPPK